jgi:hypothetical protein
MQRSAFVAMRAVEARCGKVGLRVEAEHHRATLRSDSSGGNNDNNGDARSRDDKRA